jgi:hypothetical protein
MRVISGGPALDLTADYRRPPAKFVWTLQILMVEVDAGPDDGDIDTRPGGPRRLPCGWGSYLVEAPLISAVGVSQWS